MLFSKAVLEKRQGLGLKALGVLYGLGLEGFQVLGFRVQGFGSGVLGSVAWGLGCT